MTAKKTNVLLIAVAVILCLALIIGAKVITNMLGNKSDDLVSLQVKQSSLSSEQQELAIAKKQIAQYSGLSQTTKYIVPRDKDQAEAVREIIKLAEQSNIDIAGISYPASTLGSSTNAKKSKINLSQLTPVKGISGVYVLPLTVTSGKSVGYNQLVNFLKRLENNRRTAQVSNIKLQPDKDNPSLLTFTLSLNEYIKP